MKDKAKPDVNFEPAESFVGELKNVLLKDEARKDINVRLFIKGGIPSQSYRFQLNLNGRGEVDCFIDDKLRQRHGEAKAVINIEQSVQLFSQILKANILNIFNENTLFLPDTLVGYLEITYQKYKHRVYFTPLEDQAEVQNMRMPGGLEVILEQLFDIGSKALKIDSVNP
jgi:hypothetical protein